MNNSVTPPEQADGRVSCHLHSVPLARAAGADPEDTVGRERSLAPGRRTEMVVGPHDH